MHEGHRERLDKKIREHRLELLEPHEQLEFILYNAIPRGDTNELAHKLLEKYATISGVINANVEELAKFKGVGKRCAMFLTSLPEILGIVERSIAVDTPPELSTSDKIRDFVKTYFYGKLTEAAYLICLNSTYRLLNIQKIADGEEGHAYIYQKKVTKRAILDGASVVLIVHNHPCGSVRPSAADIKLSRALDRAFDAVGIVFGDSLIVSGNEVYSIRENGYLMDINREF